MAVSMRVAAPNRQYRFGGKAKCGSEVYDERERKQISAGVFMAGSSSFTKRQKERARQERQAEKARKKAERKLQKDEPTPPTGPRHPVVTYDDDGQPEGLGFHDF